MCISIRSRHLYEILFIHEFFLFVKPILCNHQKNKQKNEITIPLCNFFIFCKKNCNRSMIPLYTVQQNHTSVVHVIHSSLIQQNHIRCVFQVRVNLEFLNDGRGPLYIKILIYASLHSKNKNKRIEPFFVLFKKKFVKCQLIMYFIIV